MTGPQFIVDYDGDTGEYDILERKSILLHGKEIITTNYIGMFADRQIANHVVQFLNQTPPPKS